MATVVKVPVPRSRSRTGHVQRPAPPPSPVVSAVPTSGFPVVLPFATGGSLPGIASRHSAVVSFLETRGRRLSLPAPLRSPGVTRLQHYYGCSDSCWPVQTPFGAPEGLLVSCLIPSDPSVAKHPSSSDGYGLVSLRRLTGGHPLFGVPQPLNGINASFGFRLYGAGSPRRQAESRSLSYGRVVHLPLLSTLPRGNAVTFGYEVQTEPRRGLTPCCYKILTSALRRHPRGYPDSFLAFYRVVGNKSQREAAG